MKVRSLLHMLLVCCASVVLFAQTETATLSGRVTDPSGAVVGGANVQVQSTLTGHEVSTKTNASGVYVVTALPPSVYRIIVTASGFRQIVKPAVTLNVQDNASINFSMTVGSTSETVTVEGGAPVLNTQDPSVSTVIDRELVDSLPLNGRSFQALIDLTPGVVLTSATFATPGQFSINGQRPDYNYFMVDGVSANIAASPGVTLTQYGAGTYPALSASGGTNSLVSIDALQEFRVQTSNFAPEYGRTPGGQISVTTRSGANQFHGTLFEFFRNDALDANDWFSDNAGLPKAALRQNNFGGVFSGPILKDKMFFFFSYEGLRLRLPQTITQQVPSMDFRQNATPTMQAILGAFPIPNGPMEPNGFQDFIGSFSTPSSFDATSLRVDYTLSSRWSLFGRYNYSPSSTSTRGSVDEQQSPSELDLFATTTQTATLGATGTITPHLVDELRFNFSRVSADQTATVDNFGGGKPFDASLVLPAGYDFSNASFDAVLNAFGTINPLVVQGPLNRNLQRQINVVDNVSYSHGTHLFKFGVDYRRMSPDQNPNAYSQLAGFADEPTTQLGAPLIVIVSSSQSHINFIYTNFSLFGQDTWKLTRRLTATYGLRWDFNPVPGTGGDTPSPATLNGLGAGAAVDPTKLTTVASANTPIYKDSRTNFAPRVGLAYQLRDDPSWGSVLRAGFGVFYDPASTIVGDSAGGYPFIASKYVFGASYPISGSLLNPPPLGTPDYPIGRIYVVDPNLKTPYSLQWNLAAEQQMGANNSLSLTYIGSEDHRLIYQEYLESPNANFNLIGYALNGGKSSYNALQVQFHRQVARGLQALASYSWSHAIDTDSNTVGGVALRRGNADFDVRNSLTVGASYDVPQPHWNTFTRKTLGGWSLDTFLYARGGMPVDLVASYNIFPTIYAIRPNIVPGAPFYISDDTAPGGTRINPAAFTAPPTGQQGDLGRNVLRGLAAWQNDFAVRREFQLRESLKLQFRAEMFNIFNHPNFGLPYHQLGSPLFGAPTQTLATSLGSGGVNGGFNPLYQIGGPRSVQFALKLQF